MQKRKDLISALFEVGPKAKMFNTYFVMVDRPTPYHSERSSVPSLLAISCLALMQQETDPVVEDKA